MRSRVSGSESSRMALFFFAFCLGQLDGCAGCYLVSAQDVDPLPDVAGLCAPEITENRRAALTHEGQPGLWFQTDIARCMLGRLVALPLYAERVRLLDQRLSLVEERDALRVRQITLAEEGEQRATGAMASAVRARRRAEEALDAWWRHPGFWAAVGALVVVGLEVLTIWAFHEVT